MISKQFGINQRDELHDDIINNIWHFETYDAPILYDVVELLGLQ